MQIRITKTMRETVVRLANGRQPTCGWSTCAEMVEAGIIVQDGYYDYRLTATGEAMANVAIQRAELVKAQRRAANRGRTAAMQSVGMTRTPYGWE